MLFHEMEVDFDIFDAETAEDYENAMERVRKENDHVPGEKLHESIRRQCGAVFTFFDDLLGEGAHKDIFGERTNLVECLETFREFIRAVEEQKGKLSTMIAEIKAETPAEVPAPNRASRRANRKVATTNATGYVE